MQNTLRRHPKQFWSFVNSKRKEDGLPVDMHLGSCHATTAHDKCNLFASHFVQVFNDSPASVEQVDSAVRDTPSDVIDFSVFRVTAEVVDAAIRKLKYSAAAGPDGIPSCILKKCSSVLTRPLALLFDASLRQCMFPTQWKESVMFPVHKKGDKRNVENYRGITSLCSCSKVFEIIVNDALFSSCRHYISADQHGFFPKRSVSTNLVDFVSFCQRNMNEGVQIDAVYTDLKAAFDRVDHGILLARLEKLGVSTAFCKWLQSYLTHRRLSVKIGSEYSSPFCNISGVPQGSNLGPLLFSLFINELSVLLPAGTRKFYADDVKIFKVIKTCTDCMDLQRLVNIFVDWCSNNLLTVSIPKCHVISFHRKMKPVEFDYTIANCPLQRVYNIRDLGVELDSALTFRLHYNDIISRANRQLGFIFKITKEFRDPYCLRSLYNSLVRSILEFGLVVWCPYQRNWITRIEAIQKKFLRYALRGLPWRDARNLPPYVERCQLLDLETLERRRTNFQAVFVAKVLTGYTDCPAILSQLDMYAPERNLRTRGFLQLQGRTANYGL